MTEKQCRICLDGPEVEHELGRLIRPCLCQGTISFVHVSCLKRWRTSSPSQSAFFVCPQCHYHYRFARTRVLGIATNPIVIGGISTVLFVLLTLISSSITTYFMSAFQGDTYYYSLWYVHPLDVARQLVRAALRIIEDSDNIASIFDDRQSRTFATKVMDTPDATPPSFLRNFIARFVIGLPLIGAASVVHMLYSIGTVLYPFHWVARFRGNQRRRNNSWDFTAPIILFLLAIGTVRVLYKVYQFTQSVTKRLLLRAEDAILEVN